VFDRDDAAARRPGEEVVRGHRRNLA
jgi:hypothetical protein